MNEYKESLQAIKAGTFFDWIANNGHRFSKVELVRFIMEYEYAVSKSDDSKRLRGTVIENLMDNPQWSEED